MDPAGDGEPAVVGGREAGVGLELDAHLGHPEGLAALRAGEDDVLHRLAAQALGAALAEDPDDRVGEVALAAAVGTDDGGELPGEAEAGGVQERLEPGQVEAVELQHAAAPVEAIGASYQQSTQTTRPGCPGPRPPQHFVVGIAREGPPAPLPRR
jgi:hypothetical protein